MRNFDQEIADRHAERERTITDRDFQLGGQTFSHIVNVSVYALAELEEQQKAEQWDYVTFYERAIESLVVEGDQKRLRSMFAAKKLVISVADLEALYRNLLEMAYGRPTEASSPSTDGDAQTGTSSTETSSTEPAVASAA